MFRFVASFLIALVAISSSLAHAQGGEQHASMEAEEHQINLMHHADMAEVQFSGDAPGNHETHDSVCGLGHCATACGVILPSFSVSVSFTYVGVGQDCAEQTLAGLITSSDPPPPKA